MLIVQDKIAAATGRNSLTPSPPSTRGKRDRQPEKHSIKRNTMTQCIGRIGGLTGDWFAELDFRDDKEATIIERTPTGRCCVATVQIGETIPEDEDHDESLDPECEQNKRLCKIVFAPEAWRLLQSIRQVIGNRKPLDRGDAPLYQHEQSDAGLLEEIDRVLECLNVPGRGE
jgi:hypothetical protein